MNIISNSRESHRQCCCFSFRLPFWVVLLSEVHKEVRDVCYASWDMMEEWGSKGCSGWLPLEKCGRPLLTSLSFSLPCCRHWKPSVPTCIFTVVAFPLLCPANVLDTAAVGICSCALRQTMFRKAGMDIQFVCSVNGSVEIKNVIVYSLSCWKDMKRAS